MIKDDSGSRNISGGNDTATSPPASIMTSHLHPPHHHLMHPCVVSGRGNVMLSGGDDVMVSGGCEAAWKTEEVLVSVGVQVARVRHSEPGVET